MPLPGLPCNGRDAYCSVRYDKLCQAATEDSAANAANYWVYPTQDQSIRSQLDSSIRALMLSIYDYNGVATVCRGSCAEGNTPLSVVLSATKDFLDANPREVVTLIIDTVLSASRIETEFTAQGLDTAALAHAASASWPTLGELIDAGHRLVVFASTADSGADWLLPRQSLLWETGGNWPSLSAMNCNPAVGDASRPLYLVHQNLVDGIDGGNLETASRALASEANDFSAAMQRLQNCQAQFNRVPNFVAVDYSSVGDVVGATQVLNGVRAAPTL